MTDKTISALTSAATPLNGVEVLPIVQSGSTVKVSVDNLTTGKNVPAVSFTTSTGNFGAGIAPGTAGDEKYFRAGLYALYGQRSTGSSDLSASWNSYIDTQDSSGNGYKYRSTGDLASAYEQNGTHRWYVAGAGTAGTAVSFTQALTIATNANVTVNTGNLVVGTAGKGIDFSANTHAAGMTSELLNDYEEGTWTPNVAFLGATSSEGTYTKIGRQVAIRGSITGVGLTVGPTGIVTDGIPYNAANDCAGSMVDAGNTQGGSVKITGPFVVACTNITATTSIIFTATYFV